MDFSALMSQEISKAIPSKSTATSTTSKYQKRAALDASRESTYREAQIAAQKAREATRLQQREDDAAAAVKDIARDEKRRCLAAASRAQREAAEAATEAARRHRLGLPPPPPPSTAEVSASGKDALSTSSSSLLSDNELRAQLRALGEPTVLFGETEMARRRRHRLATAPKPVLSDGPIPTTLVLLPEAEMRVPIKLPVIEDVAARALIYRQLASYFTLVLREWAVALDERPAVVRESYQGRQAEGGMEQSRENMRPLFRRFEKADLDEGILEPVVGIVRAAQERRYVDASDGYLRLSIGKA